MRVGREMRVSLGVFFCPKMEIERTHEDRQENDGAEGTNATDGRL